MSYSSLSGLPAASPPADPVPEPSALGAADRQPRARIPGAVYRLQLNGAFTLEHAQEIVPYLQRLGITDLYLSPILQARPGSLHGYDVIDCNRVNEELGGEAALIQLSAALKQRGMGLLLDIVPNHLCVADDGNAWWNDVLESGAASAYQGMFDIDWQRWPEGEPPRPGQQAAPLVLPVLLESLEEVLEARRLTLSVHDGALCLEYRGRRLPTDPCSWLPLLQEVRHELTTELWDNPAEDSALLAVPFLELLGELGRLPPAQPLRAEAVRQRRQGLRRCKMLLGAWLEGPLAGPSQQAFWSLLERINARPGPGADPMRELWRRLLAAQPYRLRPWREGLSVINYRRYADIADLAALRQEHPDVFSATHGLVLRLVAQGHVTGLRVDHPDGLLDPQGYLRRLQHGAAFAQGLAPSHFQALPLYVVVEKILSGNEPLRKDWPIHGTTGYEVLALLNGLFRQESGHEALQSVYERFTGQPGGFQEVLLEAKRTVLATLFESEHRALTRTLAALLESGLPETQTEQPLAPGGLQRALGEVVVQVPVYSHYLRRMHADRADDTALLRHAAAAAAAAHPDLPAWLFGRIERLALEPEPLASAGPPETPVHRGQEFALRFRQLVAAVMGKGLEDTAYYRHAVLLSLNELGCDAEHFSIEPGEFHRRLAARQNDWPGALSTLSTHDTKRSADVRARLNVLSEQPRMWEQAVQRWQALNAPLRPNYHGRPVPDAAEEYFLYQTLLGSWPAAGLEPGDAPAYEHRIQAAMRKSVREAKVHSGWIEPDSAYEAALAAFVRRLLLEPGGAAFRADLQTVLPPLALAGAYQALAQWLLLIAAPGVPDLYQGNELWDLSLVDPDNRRPVDFTLRTRLLEELVGAARNGRVALVQALRERWSDGRLKLYVISRALRFRNTHRDLFLQGGYEPVEIAGARGGQAVGFIRARGAQAALAVAGRFFSDPGGHAVGGNPVGGHPVGDSVWGDTRLRLGPAWADGRWRDVLTGRIHAPRPVAGGAELALGEVFLHLPCALLERLP